MSLQQDFHATIRRLGRKRTTERTYWQHIEHYCKWLYRTNDRRWVHPRETGRDELQSWLTYLATDRHVSAKTQNQAMQAVLFLHQHLFGNSITDVSALRARDKSISIKEILTRDEIRRLFDCLSGAHRLMVELMYGGVMRRSDVVAIRLKDIDFEQSLIALCETKHDHRHWTLLAKSLHERVRHQINRVEAIHRMDQRQGNPGVSIPYAFGRKSPAAPKELRWYYLFPSRRLSQDPETGKSARHHVEAGNLNKAIKAAANQAGITKRVTSHVIRHTSASHMHEAGVPMRHLQDYMGHTDPRTTAKYLHCGDVASRNHVSPLDMLVA